MNEPSHKLLVQRFINWQKVKDRLDQYENIASIFPLKKLEKWNDKPPYFCHYLAWRLGTWQSEEFFGFLDGLIGKCRAMPGWNYKKQDTKGPEFGNFFGFIWELQSAVLFSEGLHLSVEWTKNGPDLIVKDGPKTIFVECTTFQKSYAAMLFIEELLHLINPEIKVLHIPFLRTSFPSDDRKCLFFDKLFRPIIDDTYLSVINHQLPFNSPILLRTPKGAKNFYLYMENLSAKKCNDKLDLKLHSTGDPTIYISNALREIFKIKKGSNKLFCFHPNLVMVNDVLVTDWQTGTSLRPVPKYTLPADIDALVISASGIDQIPSLDKSINFWKDNHPISSLLINGFI